MAHPIERSVSATGDAACGESKPGESNDCGSHVRGSGDPEVPAGALDGHSAVGREDVSATAQPAKETARNRTEVYAVHGADPEVLAYAMAKYSRSALSMKESLREISSQRAEHFLNTFYFQYGHRSIADLAHIPFAVERLSLLAAIVLEDEQRWDGQERSTRYQNFRASGWYLPELGGDAEARALFTRGMEALFAEYHAVTEAMLDFYRLRVPRPQEMKEEAYVRTLRARALDVSRYLLPLATNTSVGQIVNARTLEGQISRLLSDPRAEVRELGLRLREAAAGPAWMARDPAAEELLREIAAMDSGLGSRAQAILGREVKTAPTLVKYAAPVEYLTGSQSELRQAAAELMRGEPIAPAVGLVDLLEDEPLEFELAATLLYGVSAYPYRQIRARVEALDAGRRGEIVSLGAVQRGPHDELRREFASGHRFRFDILMDIGGFRDMHRHRRCIQILQPFTAEHGYATPEAVEQSGLRSRYEAAMEAAHALSAALSRKGLAEEACYALPLGFRTRALFKMDFAQALYIAELRTAPAGHVSYRRVAWEMYRAVCRKHPSLAQYFRVTDIEEPVNLLNR